jgi:hypothetical protein
MSSRYTRATDSVQGYLLFRKINMARYGTFFSFSLFFYVSLICWHLSLGNYYEGIMDAVTFECTQKPRACGEKESYIGGQDVLEPTKFHVFICKEDSCH